jgi:hypothetical protein
MFAGADPSTQYQDVPLHAEACLSMKRRTGVQPAPDSGSFLACEQLPRGRAASGSASVPQEPVAHTLSSFRL